MTKRENVLRTEQDEKQYETENVDDYTPDMDCVRVGDVYEHIENGRYVPGTLSGVVVDIPYAQGGLFTRLSEALKVGGKVVIPEKLYSRYRDTVQVYFGEFEKKGRFYVAQKGY